MVAKKSFARLFVFIFPPVVLDNKVLVHIRAPTLRRINGAFAGVDAGHETPFPINAGFCAEICG